MTADPPHRQRQDAPGLERLRRLTPIPLARKGGERSRRRFDQWHLSLLTWFEHAPHGYIILDHQGGIVVANVVAVRLLGVKRHRLPGRLLTDFIAPDCHDLCREQWQALLHRRSTTPLEIQLIRSDGGVLAVDCYTSSFPDLATGQSRLLVELVDRTAFRFLVGKLQHAEARWYSLVQQAPNLILLTDLTGGVVFANRPVPGLEGEDPATLRLDGILSSLPRQVRQDALHRLRHGGDPEEFEVRLDTTGGPPEWWSYRIGAVGEALAVTGYLLVGTRITRLKSTEAALGQSERRLREIVEDQTELICRFKPDGTLIFANRAFCQFFGLHRERLGDCPVPLPIPEPDRETLIKLLHTLTPDRPVTSREQRIALPGCPWRWVHWTHRAIFNPPNDLSEFQSVGRETTEERRMQDAVQRLKDELELQERHRLAGVIHDGVGQSLQAVNLGLKMVLAGVGRSEPIDMITLQEVVRESSDAIEQLRTVTTTLRPAFLDRMNLVEAVRWWGAKLGQRTGVRITVHAEAVHPVLDRLELRIKHNCFQILQEALTNSVKHSGSLEVEITLRTVGDTALELLIVDHGRGFDPVKAREAAHGLGLAIIPERVARLGGKVEMKSSPGHGTRLCVTIPIPNG